MCIKPKKILMITSSTVGGGPNQLLLLASELQNNYEITIATPFDDFYLNKLNILSLSDTLLIQRRSINLFDLLRLIYFLKINQISIIHSHGKGAGALGRISSLVTGIPLIHTFHGIHITGKNFISRLIYIFYEKVFSQIDFYDVYVSQSEKIMAKKYFHPNNYSLIIPNGVRNYSNEFSSISHREKIRSMLNINKDTVSVITLCSLERVKNLFETLSIAKYCPELSFWIIGEGSLLNDIKKTILRDQLENVILPGFFQEPREFLCAADIYLSSSYREGHPLSILEAMSVALPVVASNVVGNCQTIEHSSSGFYYKLGDVYEASSHLKYLANDSNLRVSFGMNAQLLQREKFSSKIMAERYNKLYKKIKI